jgi:putative ABC transport system ATP-binding protein
MSAAAIPDLAPAASAAPALDARGIVKDFPSGDGTTRVLHGIDLALDAGRLTLLVGPSGCGKTTLLSIVTGILSPTAGQVDVMGERITSLRGRRKALFRLRTLGFIFQQYNLLPALTAAENAAVPLVAAGVALAAATRRATETLARLGMAEHAGKLPSQLSGGQQQRVAIARAFVHEPAVIVCDEPTAALDEATGQTVMSILREIARDPRHAVLAVTHDTRVYHSADRIVQMNDGRVSGELAPPRTPEVAHA